jgi:hypothetical protein
VLMAIDHVRVYSGLPAGGPEPGIFFTRWITHFCAPYSSVPPEQQWSLGMLYFVFLIDLVLLYLACRWYAKYKSDHPEKKWLAYI